MDLDEWEFLPDSKAFMDFGHEGGGKELLRKELSLDDKLILEMNYFICPSKPATPSSRHVGAEDDSGGDHGRSAVKQAASDHKEFKDIGIVLPPPVILDGSDVVSQVFFKKMKENEFADMKVTSPKSCGRGFAVPLPEPEPIRLGAGEEETVYDLDREVAQKPALGEAADGSDVKSKHGWEGFSVSIWRWKLTGVGALCSIGVAAAATICCIFVLGGRQRQRQQHQHPKIQLQIYADEKRIKHAVHQATRLNHALSAARGAHMTRAHISFGGYYEGL